MESIKKLEDALKEVTRDLSKAKSSADESINQANSAEARKKLLEADIKALESKKDKLDLEIKAERKNQIDELEAKLKDVNLLQEQLKGDIQKFKSASAAVNYKEAEFKEKLAETEQAKQEYQDKVSELKAKLNKLEEMQAILK